DLNGKLWDLRDLKGKVVLVNFWATWCPPCRKEMPDLKALANRFKDQDLIILAISDESQDDLGRFVAAEQIPFPVLLDPGGKAKDAFLVKGIPATFLYDRSGQLAAQLMAGAS